MELPCAPSSSVLSHKLSDKMKFHSPTWLPCSQQIELRFSAGQVCTYVLSYLTVFELCSSPLCFAERTISPEPRRACLIYRGWFGEQLTASWPPHEYQDSLAVSCSQVLLVVCLESSLCMLQLSGFSCQVCTLRLRFWFPSRVISQNMRPIDVSLVNTRHQGSDSGSWIAAWLPFVAQTLLIAA